MTLSLCVAAFALAHLTFQLNGSDAELYGRVHLAQQEAEAIVEGEEPPDPFASDLFKQTCRSNCKSEAISEGHRCSTQNIASPDMNAFNNCMDSSRAMKSLCEAQCNDVGG